MVHLRSHEYIQVSDHWECSMELQFWIVAEQLANIFYRVDLWLDKKAQKMHSITLASGMGVISQHQPDLHRS